MNLHFPFFEYVYALLAWDLRYLLVGAKDFLVYFFSDFNMKVLGPVAYIKQTGFQYSQRVLSAYLLPQIIL